MCGLELPGPAPGDEIGLYVHIPFCIRKCHYCDFNSIAFEAELAARYEASLLLEARRWGRFLGERGVKMKTIYIGGGTPTCLAPEALGRILAGLHSEFELQSGCEVTCEANPGTLSPRVAEVLLQGGVNRLSLGAQAMQNSILKRLGRLHTSECFLRSFQIAREAGFTNINVDLISAIPGQTLAEWEETITGVANLGPEHISTYNLTIEEGTEFARLRSEGSLPAVEEELDARMYGLAEERLCSLGYRHYEISNFALPGRECRHNLIYWRNEGYLGIGAGAHSRLGASRHYNFSSLERYCLNLESGSLPIDGMEPLSLERDMSDTVILGLRLEEGVSDDRFRERFGVSLWQIYSSPISKCERLGLIELKDGILRLTPRGRLLANEVFMEFLP